MTQPGIIQKIVQLCFIKSEKSENDSQLLMIPKNEHIKSHIQISYIVPDAMKVNRMKKPSVFSQRANLSEVNYYFSIEMICNLGLTDIAIRSDRCCHYTNIS